MTFYQHQTEGLNRVKGRSRCALYWDMGTGKTYAGAEQMMRCRKYVNLVICQKSKINDWIEHFRSNYDFPVYDLTKPKQFEEFYGKAMGQRFYIVGVINYELAWRRSRLMDLEDFTLMLDESSLIQNQKAKQTKAILKMNPSAVVLLSGTPTSGKYENLWTQAHLLGWPISEELFLRQYVNWTTIDVGQIKHKIVDKKNPYRNIERLRSKFREHGADFLKTDECFDLPEQIFQRITVPASKYYRTFAKKHIVDLPNGQTLVGDTEFADRLHKRELCGMYSEEKLTAFRDLVQSTNDRLIVFYNFNLELDWLRLVAVDCDRPHGAINGTTKNLRPYEEHDNSITFVQYQAGAMGLNLQKANRIVYFSLPDGRSDLFEQSKKRIHRIGQTKPCFYYLLTCSGTIEEDVERTLDVRRDFTDKLFLKG